MATRTSCIIYILLVVAVVLVACAESSLYKSWSKNTNFGDEANWDPRPPCSGDIISFPATTDHVSILLDVGATVKEMVLPLNGEMMFTNNAELIFNDNVPSTLACPFPGAEVTFTPHARHWFDPGNWAFSRNLPTSDRRKRDITSDNINLLDTEIVPCVHDIVSFPTDSAFNVIIDSDITVSAISYKGRMYTSTEFSEFLNSDDGQNQFSYADDSGSRPVVLITGQSCTDVTGCNCGNDRQEIRDVICRLKEESDDTCPGTMCTEPILASGDCCDTCGALLILQYNSDFVMNDFKQMIQNKISSQAQYISVDATVSKMWTGDIQVLLEDQGDGVLADQFGSMLKDDIDNGIAHGNGISGVTKTQSGGANRKTKIDRPLTKGSVAAIIMVILMVAIICILGFLYVRRKGSFKWWKRGQATITDDTVTYSRESGQVDGLASVRGFDNPMYQTTTEVKLEAETLGATGGSDDDIYATVAKPAKRRIVADINMSDVSGDLGFQNPVYDAATVLDDDTQDTFF